MLGRYLNRPHMAKSAPQPPVDVLVLGEHPAAYLTAALLKNKSKLSVIHATLPDERVPDRLVLINPEMFDLHPLLGPMRRKLETTSIYGLQFLADDAATRSEHRAKSILGLVANYKDVRTAFQKVAASEGVDFLTPKQVQVHRLDEKGLEITVGKIRINPKVLVLAGPLPEAQQKMLGLPEAWGIDVVHRYTFVKFKGAKYLDLGGKPLVPMSLDVQGRLTWAWLLPHGPCIQLAVEQPVETLNQVKPAELLAHWANVLKKHNVLKADAEIPLKDAQSMDLPLGGALAHEGLANRTLLVGPAGGFYSASGEDIYPNVWSALSAADSIKKALKEPHLQDALNPYRHNWRTTLGDYLRGPQQNLRFLLPLVYRNQVMTTRLTEAILLGKGMVR
jgi:flavin-dependent dehydrogenase